LIGEQIADPKALAARRGNAFHTYADVVLVAFAGAVPDFTVRICAGHLYADERTCRYREWKRQHHA
jgi:hypothetical protein